MRAVWSPKWRSAAIAPAEQQCALAAACRPANAQEMVERSSQVIQCNEALREVTLYQSVGGKSLSRTFRYDKASRDILFENPWSGPPLQPGSCRMPMPGAHGSKHHS